MSTEPDIGIGWSRFTAKDMIEASGRVEKDQFIKLNNQLRAVCEVHAATSNALSKNDEQKLKMITEIEVLKDQVEKTYDHNEILMREQEDQRVNTEMLKDKVISAHEKLGTLAEYQIERSELHKQTIGQMSELNSLREKVKQLTKQNTNYQIQANDAISSRDDWKRQAEAQLRCNEQLVSDCKRLKHQLSRSISKRGQHELTSSEYEKQIRILEGRLQKSNKIISSREDVIESQQNELKKSKRQRISIERSFQDEQDKAKERELWIRSLRRENLELKERLCSFEDSELGLNTSDETGNQPEERIPVIEIGRKSYTVQPNDVLQNLKMQNKLQMLALNNSLQQLMHTVDTREKFVSNV